MNIETVTVSEGMEVFSSDGKAVGKVSHVWKGITDTSTDVMSTGYFQVDQGGLLGLGTTHLYIPFSAVEETTPDQCVTIACASDDCTQRYTNKPDFLT